ncbi:MULTISPECIES: phosphoethanolamine transferase [unclassified Providencia]|uniref:phosphoethanolamine transferase n=1 Tax=unclassified Providencia TaxID=2633465 RepID=UPI00234AFACA|nr:MULTISPECIES: phosphoethanolamine transferase [unclassified Providencia]WOB99699.1 phosphoethanolamine transferase [Providencia sp. PROV046]
MTKKIDIKKIIFSILALTILIVFSKMMLRGSGISHPSVRDITLVCLFFIILSSSQKAYWLIGSIIVTIYALYTPIGLTFGTPTYQYLASLIATDALETAEFFTQIPLKNYLSILVIIGGFILFKKITNSKKIQFYKNKSLIICLIIIALIDQVPFRIFNEGYQSINSLQKELETLSPYTQKSSWGVSTLKNDEKHYDDYILIVGESVRRDYMGVYGYPINNTPFLSHTNGTIVDGLTAPGTNTISSLRLMLTLPNITEWAPNYGLNFIDLAESAGFKTYWLSNQGFIGEYDTPVSFIAARSSLKKFMKIGAYNSSNSSDFELLDIFKKELNTTVSKNQKRLFVIHLYGSHPDACARIEDFENKYLTKDDKYTNISCYVASIEKTDQLISKIYDALKSQENKNNRTFSILYFADHGLSHNLVDNKLKMSLSNSSTKILNIPLIKISSDDKDRNYIKSKKSGLFFTEGLANWLGINNAELKENYSLFSSLKDDEKYDPIEQYKGLSQDHDDAIDIREK